MKKEERRRCIDRLKSIWSIIGKRQFVLITMATSFFQSYLVYGIILMPSCIIITFPEIENIVPGKIFLISTIGQVAGVAVAGKLLDRFKTFKKAVLLSVIIMILSCVGLFFAHSRRKMTLLYILYTTINTAGGVYLPSAIELLVETTYPANKLLLMSLYTSISNTFIVIFTSITRLLMTKRGVPTATLATVGFLVVSMVAILMVKPDYKRHKTDLNTTALNSKRQNKELYKIHDTRSIGTNAELLE
uniref:uncharacterized protein LOC120339695 n=1 Tax=Styela clava TaxID=7725 RepID=UPI00193A8E27|nr:uncharacterized protein LOC120339695 [Styela clava]